MADLTVKTFPSVEAEYVQSRFGLTIQYTFYFSKELQYLNMDSVSVQVLPENAFHLTEDKDVNLAYIVKQLIDIKEKELIYFTAIGQGEQIAHTRYVINNLQNLYSWFNSNSDLILSIRLETRIKTITERLELTKLDLLAYSEELAALNAVRQSIKALNAEVIKTEEVVTEIEKTETVEQSEPEKTNNE